MRGMHGSAESCCLACLPAAALQVYVLWPDDGAWYKGSVEEVDVEAGNATIYYDETEVHHTMQKEVAD